MTPKLFHVFIPILLFLTKCSGYQYDCVGKECPYISDPVDYEETSVPCNGTESFFKDPKDPCLHFNYCPPAQEPGLSCKNITAIRYECPSGYAYHERKHYCVPKHSVRNCAPVYCPPYIYDGVLPDPKDCKTYYRCMDGFAIRYKCQKGSVFEPESGRCEEYQDLPACLKKPEVIIPATTVATTAETTTKTETTTTSPTSAPTTASVTTVTPSPTKTTTAQVTEVTPEPTEIASTSITSVSTASTTVSSTTVSNEHPVNPKVLVGLGQNQPVQAFT